MKRLVTVVLWMLLWMASVSAQTSCNGCTMAGEGRNRPVRSQTGGPDRDLVCVYVSMPNPCDSVVVEMVDAAGKATVIEDYGLGAAVNMAQKSPFAIDKDGKQIVNCTGQEKAMVCAHRDRIEASTTYIRLVPGDKGTCQAIRDTQLRELMSRGSWGPERALRLGWSAPGSTHAPQGFATLRAP